MTQPSLPSKGEMFTATVSNLAAAYGVDEDAMHVAVYAIAEQIHAHYCLSRGIVNHTEARPDQHVAVSVLAGLAGADWWLVKGVDRRPLSDTVVAALPAEPPEPFTHFGDDSVLGWSDDTPES